MNKKLNFINLLSVIILLITISAISSTIMYSNKIKQLGKISNSFYNEDSIYFYQSLDEINYDDLYHSITNNMLLYNQISTSEDIRGVIFKGKIEIPNLIDGEFFSEKVFESSSSKLAVVGKLVDTVEVNGVDCYFYNNEYYKIIGTVGYSYPTKLDKMVLLSMNSELLYPKVQYIVSSNSVEQSKKFVFNEKIFGDVLLFERDNAGILYVTNTGKSPLITTISFIIILFINSFTLIYFWVEKKHDEIIIMKINGFTNRQVYKVFFNEFTILSIISTIIGIIFGSVFSFLQNFFSISSVIGSSVFLFILFELFFLITMKKEIVQTKNIKAGEIE